MPSQDTPMDFVYGKP